MKIFNADININSTYTEKLLAIIEKECTDRGLDTHVYIRNRYSYNFYDGDTGYTLFTLSTESIDLFRFNTVIHIDADKRKVSEGSGSNYSVSFDPDDAGEEQSNEEALDTFTSDIDPILRTLDVIAAIKKVFANA